MITTKQKKLNDFIIKEAGLELDSENHVFDQDTGLPITVKGNIIILQFLDYYLMKLNLIH